MAIIKQSTAYTRVFLMIDSADHVTGKTGLTVTATLSKAGGAFAAAGGAVTEISSGYYKLALNTTDTNTLGDLAYLFTATGADPTGMIDQVSARINDDMAYPATSGRSIVVDASGLVDANTVKIGPTGSGTAQTAKDVGGAVPAAAAGASGGLLISGSNAGTTTLGALTVTGATTLTGNVSMAAGLNITQSSANTSALVITGNGTGHGAVITSGSGATGDGVQVTAASTNGNGLKLTKTGTGVALASPTTDIVLAKTTNITGFNDIAATAIVSGGAITTSGGAVSTVTTVTNQLTAAAIATGVWQDATAGDFTTASSIGKALYIANIVPGASGGHMISGSNAGTTTFGALTVTGATTLTGNVAVQAGLNITQSSGNTSALVITGNGTGHGAVITSGSGATGDGVQMTSAATNGNGLKLTKTGTGVALASPTTDMVVPTVTAVTGLTASNLDTTISSRMATYTQPTGFLAATFPAGTVANTTNITAGTITTATNVTTVNGLAANVITAASMAADASAEIADAVWDEAIAGHLGAGSTGAALNAAGSAGDPWTTPLPGAYGAGTAGFIIGTNLDAPISVVDTNVDAILVDTAEIGVAGAGLTALASATNLATVDTVVDAIKVKTDSLTFTVAGQVDSNTLKMNSATVNGNGTAGDLWRG